jgi:CRP-like cAMP-binding protein
VPFSRREDSPSEKTVLELLSRSTPDTVKDLPRKDDILYFQGDEALFLYAVSSGEVLTLLESPFGDPVLWEILDRYDAVGGFAILLGCPYPATCRALTPARVFGYSRQKVWDLLRNEPGLFESLAKGIGDRFQSFLSRLVYAQKNLEDRVLLGLLYLYRKKIRSAPDTSGPVVLEITRSLLASLSFTTVESTIRITKKWESEGWLDFPERGLIRLLDIRHFLDRTSYLSMHESPRAARSQEKWDSRMNPM